jgi:hypothetical protein
MVEGEYPRFPIEDLCALFSRLDAHGGKLAITCFGKEPDRRLVVRDSRTKARLVPSHIVGKLTPLPLLFGLLPLLLGVGFEPLDRADRVGFLRLSGRRFRLFS